MPKFLLNDNEVEFKQGQTIIQAAKEAGVEIPHFCWHPSLSVSGNCRVCLVEVEKMPKLVIACSTLATEGMVVKVDSEKALAARNAVMEFLLINHPLDCPICDEAGECKLQDYAYKHGKGESRFEEMKTRKDKRVELGPHIVFDGDRCISCSRCIRFSDEIAGENQLTFVKRGDRVTITTFPGKKFDNPYTLNTTDICPVGALTSKEFRFSTRVWEMSSTKSICIGCSRGCNTEIWVRNNKVMRLTPRFNDKVNNYWMCDRGRVETFEFVNAESRIDGPMIREDGFLRQAEWDEAAKEAVKRLKKYKASEIAFIGSAFATCEDNYSMVKLAKSLGVSNIDFVRHIKPGDSDKILITEDKAPNSLGAETVGVKPGANGLDFEKILQAVRSKNVKALFILDDDIAALSGEIESTLMKLELLIVHSSNFNKTTELADIIFPASTYAEKNGTFINLNGMIQRIRPAVATAEMDRALDGMERSRWDKFGTKFDRWAKGHKYDAKPGWQICGMIYTNLGHKSKTEMAEEVFSELASQIPVFKGLDYDMIGEAGVKLQTEKSKSFANVQ